MLHPICILEKIKTHWLSFSHQLFFSILLASKFTFFLISFFINSPNYQQTLLFFIVILIMVFTSIFDWEENRNTLFQHFISLVFLILVVNITPILLGFMILIRLELFVLLCFLMGIYKQIPLVLEIMLVIVDFLVNFSFLIYTL